jgi:hypothetical protein
MSAVQTCENPCCKGSRIHRAASNTDKAAWKQEEEPADCSIKKRQHENFVLPIFLWCRGTELNCRHGDFQSPALPTELPRRVTILHICLPLIWQVLFTERYDSGPSFQEAMQQKMHERHNKFPEHERLAKLHDLYCTSPERLHKAPSSSAANKHGLCPL